MAVSTLTRRAGSTASTAAVAALVALATALVALLTAFVAPAATAACSANPGAAVRGKTPMCETNPGAMQITLGAGAVSPGGTVSVTGSGYEPDQAVYVRFNDDDMLTPEPFVADASGAFSGTVTLPSQAVFDAYRTVRGAESFWLRFLSSDPAVSLYRELTLAQAAPAPSPSASTSGAGTTTTSGSTTTGTGTTTAGGSATAAGTGELPQTGIEDDPALLAGIAGGLAILAAAAWAADRRVRTRRVQVSR